MAVVGCHIVPPSYTLGIQGPAGRTLRGVLEQRQSTAKSHLLAHLAYRLRPHENFQFFFVPPLPTFTRKPFSIDLPSFGLAVSGSFRIFLINNIPEPFL